MCRMTSSACKVTSVYIYAQTKHKSACWNMLQGIRPSRGRASFTSSHCPLPLKTETASERILRLFRAIKAQSGVEGRRRRCHSFEAFRTNLAEHRFYAVISPFYASSNKANGPWEICKYGSNWPVRTAAPPVKRADGEGERKSRLDSAATLTHFIKSRRSRYALGQCTILERAIQPSAAAPSLPPRVSHSDVWQACRCSVKCTLFLPHTSPYLPGTGGVDGGPPSAFGSPSSVSDTSEEQISPASERSSYQSFGVRRRELARDARRTGRGKERSRHQASSVNCVEMRIA